MRAEGVEGRGMKGGPGILLLVCPGAEGVMTGRSYYPQGGQGWRKVGDL